MGKAKSIVLGSTFGALVALFATSQSAWAQENPCQGVVEHRLQEYGLTMSDLNDVEWLAQGSGRHQDGPVVSYHMWSVPKSCGSGNLVFAMTDGCYITTVYTQGGCTVKGVPSY
jgi:hypothetical protein